MNADSGQRPAAGAPSGRPGWGWAVLAAVSPLWFLWRRRYVEFVLIWAVLLVCYWRAVMESWGYVQIDALWLSLVALVFEPFAVPPGSVLSRDGGGMFLLAMMAAQPAWALFVATRPGARRRSWTSMTLCAAVFAAAFSAFDRIHIPGTKLGGYVASMRSDLQNLVAVMDSLHGARGTYAFPYDSLELRRRRDVMIRIISATDSGWSALATYGRHEGWACGVFGGRGRVPWAGAEPGQPLCVRMREVALRRPTLDDLVRDDFARLVVAQDSFRAVHGRYAPSLDSLGFVRQGGMPFTMSATATGWGAHAIMEVHFNRECAIAGGDAQNRVRPSTAAGRMACRRT